MYKFKFQKVLEYRKSIEDQKKNTLSLYNKRYLNAKEDLDNLNHSLQYSNDMLEQHVNSGVSINELRSMHEEQKYYREGIRNKTKVLIKAEEDIKQGRYELMKAMQNKKTMERLKEIYYDEYQYDEQRKFEKHIEEIISFKECDK
ncbi:MULTISPECIES: flagellar FliJ family protein [Lutispora]|uniref:Flagellar FliJ protein n=1 Tax=Lutispora saccharofermentans TaxID=3024236 RepID=A0ABT1N9S1_9FIRM|nr:MULTISPECIES: flagellar FliJ family protein [Lutispora]MCQ1528000.1 flagellar FliJ family protein [Lutispora saccharofermentans]MEA4960626.1 flagellar FliJ family protein [Lutispora sp.]HCJ57910.1 hypothetical protein [Clostridiaceae bacterium]